jgi:predicted nucleic acid-binding protein
MAFLLDTGILLRFVNTNDRQHSTIQAAIGLLIARGEQLFTATQNVAEYYNVATRPIANNGLGRRPDEVVKSVERDIEPICFVLAENDGVFGEIKRLASKYAVVGKQVHDARLVAMMLTWQIENILTLNDRHFRRFEPEGITVVTPTSLIDSDT